MGFKQVLTVFQGSFILGARRFTRSFKLLHNVSKLFPGGFKIALRKYHVDILKMYHNCFMGVSFGRYSDNIMVII